jgi:hypothetical protein
LAEVYVAELSLWTEFASLKYVQLVESSVAPLKIALYLEASLLSQSISLEQLSLLLEQKAE